MNTVIVIEKRELSFLLSCQGVRRYFGLPIKMPPKEQMQEMVAGMCRKGWLLNDGSRFQIGGRPAKMTGQIAGVKAVYFFFPANERLPLCCLYPGEPPLIMQESFVRRNCVLLQWMTQQQLKNMLQDAGVSWEGKAEEAEGWMRREKRNTVNKSMDVALRMGDVRADMLPEKLKTRSEMKEYPKLSVLIEKMNTQRGVLEKQFGFWREGLHDFFVERDMETKVMSVSAVTGSLLQALWEELGGFGELG